MMLCYAKFASALLCLAFIGIDPASACGCCCCAKKSAAAPAEKAVDPGKSDVKTQDITLSVSGMSCASCATKVQKALVSVPWVRKAQVDREKNQAVVTVEADKYDPSALLKALEKAGYGGKVVK